MLTPNGININFCVASGKTITVGIGSQLTSIFELHISNAVTNPSSTTPTSTFKFASYDASNNILDQQNSGIFLTASTGSMSSVTLTPASDVIGFTSTLTVRFTPNHPIPAGASILVTFPKWNPSASSSNQRDYLQGAVSCQNVANLNSNL